jgi:SH3 domain-containing protein
MAMKKLLLAGIAALLLATGTVHAVGTCDVADPTGTALNVRDRPNGKILGTLRNGTEVVIIDASDDWKWAKIFPVRTKNYSVTSVNRKLEGWVFYDFLDCGEIAKAMREAVSSRVGSSTISWTAARSPRR